MTDEFEPLLDEAIESVEADKRERERKAEEGRLSKEQARSRARALTEEVVAPAVSSSVEPIRNRGHWAYAHIKYGEDGDSRSWPSVDFRFWPYADREVEYTFTLHLTVLDGRLTFRESSKAPWGTYSGISGYPDIQGDDVSSPRLKKVIAEFVKKSLETFTKRT